MSEHRFVVGIDLGTTNCSLAYADLSAKTAGPPTIGTFPIPQLTGPGEFAPLSVLPSFLYIPGDYDIAAKDMSAPWSIDQRSREDRNFCGAFARDHGAKVPTRLVSSAKSWLCHRDADARARILPWGAGNEVFKVSPVQASAHYLKHIRKAWNVAVGDDQEDYLENQLVIITIPASFDEVARDLSLEAARMAGLNDVLLLEEPLAAFYNWLRGHEHDWSDHVGPNQLVLVCDVGGGTTDFTLISLKPSGGTPRFERIAVGDHLILGGDNMDVSIARDVAQRLRKSPEAMPADAWKTLCHQCRHNKERILGGAMDVGRITVMGRGSGLIGGTISTPIHRADIEAVVLERFFPLSGTNDHTELSLGNAPWGLPYESDTAITGHLLRFLQRHRAAVAAVSGKDGPCPDLILCNGGALKPDHLRNRIRDAIDGHFPDHAPPGHLESSDMDLAVSLGAAYYGLVKAGHGVRVGSGSPRSYYIGVAHEPTADAGRPRQAVCLVERGLEEGSSIALPDRPLSVLANQPVAFDLFSSSFRSGDRCGDVVDIDDTFSTLPALNTVVQFGNKGVQTEIPVHMEAVYTEVGTLEIWCRSVDTPHRWQLRFQLRGAEAPDVVAEAEVLEASMLDAAKETLRTAFITDLATTQPARLMSDIAEVVGRSKQQWPLSLLRDLADTLLTEADVRDASAQVEARWLNLVGFCMRPGMGEGFDAHRVNTLWKTFKKGPVHGNAPQVRTEWWILWRRVAAGLTPGQQRQFYQDVAAVLDPKKKARIPRQESMEMWMALASMERLHARDKTTLGRQLIDQFKAKKPPAQLLWALSRIGAREPLYASIDRVVPPGEIADWLETILGMNWKNPKPIADMLAQLCRKTGDPLRDVTTAVRGRVLRWLEQAGTVDDVLTRISTVTPRRQRETDAVFGEALPAGLILLGDGS